jgi:hypothetical protein
MAGRRGSSVHELLTSPLPSGDPLETPFARAGLRFRRIQAAGAGTAGRPASASILDWDEEDWAMNGIRSLCALALCGVFPVCAPAQETLDFAGETWTLTGDARVASVEGREVLQLRSGRLLLPSADFGNGTIEFDFRSTGHRSFAGLGFRSEASGRGFEYFYIRPHQTGRFDAMQYTPVDHGLSAWQIYAEHNAPAWFTPDEWVHVRLEVQDSRLGVYVGDQEEPALSVESMVRDPRSGGLVLVANFPQQNELDLYPTEIADLSITSARSELQRWDVSQAFPAPESTITRLPREIAEGDWESIWTHDEAGRLNIGRSRARVQSEYGTTVLARTVIHSDRVQTKQLNFGFSDRGSVFLNGELLFTGDNSYLSRSERYLGVMTVDNDALTLPLREGENELVFAVTEVFGGWGLVARFDDLEGVEVSPTTP